MATGGWVHRAVPVLASVAIYWIGCLVVLSLVYPYAPGQTGFPWAPWTYLVVGVIALPMDLADGFGVDPRLFLLHAAGLVLSVAAVFHPRLGWAALPGLSGLGLLGAIQFSGGYG